MGKTAVTHKSLDLELLITIGSLCQNLSHVLNAKGYLKSCHGNCVPKFSPSEITNITFEKECGNPH